MVSYRCFSLWWRTELVVCLFVAVLPVCIFLVTAVSLREYPHSFLLCLYQVQVVCTIGSAVFVSILLIRGIWSGLSYLQQSRNYRANEYDDDNHAWTGARPVSWIPHFPNRKQVLDDLGKVPSFFVKGNEGVWWEETRFGSCFWRLSKCLSLCEESTKANRVLSPAWALVILWLLVDCRLLAK